MKRLPLMFSVIFPHAKLLVLIATVWHESWYMLVTFVINRPIWMKQKSDESLCSVVQIFTILIFPNQTIIGNIAKINFTQIFQLKQYMDPFVSHSRQGGSLFAAAAGIVIHS